MTAETFSLASIGQSCLEFHHVERIHELEAAAEKADELLAGMWSYNEVSRENLSHTHYVQASEVLRHALHLQDNEP